MSHHFWLGDGIFKIFFSSHLGLKMHFDTSSIGSLRFDTLKFFVNTLKSTWSFSKISNEYLKHVPNHFPKCVHANIRSVVMNSRWPAPMLSHSLLFGQRVLASQLQDLWFARKCTEGKIGRMWIVRIDDVYFARWPIFSRSSFPNAHMRPPKSRSGQSSSSSSSIVYASPFAKSMWRIYICKIYPIGVTVGVVYYIAKWIPLVFDRIQRHRKLAIGTKTAEILLSCFVSSVPLRYMYIPYIMQRNRVSEYNYYTTHVFDGVLK